MRVNRPPDTPRPNVNPPPQKNRLNTRLPQPATGVTTKLERCCCACGDVLPDNARFCITCGASV